MAVTSEDLLREALEQLPGRGNLRRRITQHLRTFSEKAATCDCPSAHCKGYTDGPWQCKRTDTAAIKKAKS